MVSSNKIVVLAALAAGVPASPTATSAPPEDVRIEIRVRATQSKEKLHSLLIQNERRILAQRRKLWAIGKNLVRNLPLSNQNQTGYGLQEKKSNAGKSVTSPGAGSDDTNTKQKSPLPSPATPARSKAGKNRAGKKPAGSSDAAKPNPRTKLRSLLRRNRTEDKKELAKKLRQQIRRQQRNRQKQRNTVQPGRRHGGHSGHSDPNRAGGH